MENNWKMNLNQRTLSDGQFLITTELRHKMNPKTDEIAQLPGTPPVR